MPTDTAYPQRAMTIVRSFPAARHVSFWVWTAAPKRCRDDKMTL